MALHSKATMSRPLITRARRPLTYEVDAVNERGEASTKFNVRAKPGEQAVLGSSALVFTSTHKTFSARLSTEGKLYTCLFATAGHDLRALLRSEGSDREISSVIAQLWRARDDRYSELRTQNTEGLTPARKKVEMSYIGG